MEELKPRYYNKHSYIIPLKKIAEAGLFEWKEGEFVSRADIQVDETGQVLVVSLENMSAYLDLPQNASRTP